MIFDWTVVEEASALPVLRSDLPSDAALFSIRVAAPGTLGERAGAAFGVGVGDLRLTWALYHQTLCAVWVRQVA